MTEGERAIIWKSDVDGEKGKKEKKESEMVSAKPPKKMYRTTDREKNTASTRVD